MYVVDLSVKLALIIFVGFVAGKLRIIGETAQKNIMGLLMNLALPCLIVTSFAVDPAAAEIWHFGAVVLAAVITLLLSGLLGHLIYIRMGRSDMGAAVKVCLIFTNVSFFGVPVAAALYGGALFMYYNVFGSVVRTANYAFSPLFLGNKAPKRGFCAGLKDLLSPPLVAVIVGLVFYFSSLTLPRPLEQAVASIGDMTSPMGMLVIGAMLSRARLSDMRKMPVTLLITLMRLVLLPAAGVGILWLLGVEEYLFRLVTLYLCMPVGMLLPSYIMRFRPSPDGELVASISVCLTSVLCIFTIPVWATVLDLLF